MTGSLTSSFQNEKALGEHLENASEYDFGGESRPPVLSEDNERKLWRKIDLRLMPILCVMYLMSFMERGNIGNAKLQGLTTQLNLTGNQYNIALTMYFIHLTMGFSLVLKKFRPSIWLPGITVRVSSSFVGELFRLISRTRQVVWGVIMTLMGLVKTFGEFSTPISQLLTVPPYVLATIVLGFFSYYSDKVTMRSPFILAGQIICLIGLSINIANVSHNAKYFGTFLIVAGSYSGLPGIVVWLSTNLSGQYKRGIGMALHIGIGNLSGVIASNIFRMQDKPRYILGRTSTIISTYPSSTTTDRVWITAEGMELMFVGIGLIFLPITVFTYSRINKKKAELMKRVAQGLEKRPSPEELRVGGQSA
ncbi:uncharacterized protein C8R40DRAFT_1167531 [Lentinula edodes]|uniref:uncharacterized protein n=1 Tax=Lentinula edodes TaxID=5353 RepID=UPI001E8ECA66|nr:uncharacterized protein C8R40DRAFT_1167531 [Lentinula edodes]KAH7878132.1 hypothetical protein C8R40DRAFT_1167531 [Lentinula edodes]